MLVGLESCGLLDTKSSLFSLSVRRFSFEAFLFGPNIVGTAPVMIDNLPDLHTGSAKNKFVGLGS